MVYISSFAIGILLAYLDLSFLPHLLPWYATPILIVPFLAILSIKDATIFPIILAFIIGFVYDASSLGGLPIFTVSLVLMVLLSKILFSRLSNYGIMRTSLLLSSIALAIIYASSYQLILSNFSNYNVYINIAISAAITLIFCAVIYLILRKYFDWIEKTTSERFR